MEQISGFGIVINNKHRVAKIFKTNQGYFIEIELIKSAEFQDLNDSEATWKAIREVEAAIGLLES